MARHHPWLSTRGTTFTRGAPPVSLHPWHTTHLAAQVDSNPINKQTEERGLTSKGKEQVRRPAKALLTLTPTPTLTPTLTRCVARSRR